MTGRYHTLQIGSWADSVGRENMANVFAEFDCSKNADIDGFLKNNAVDFARRQISVSHLVFDSATRACLGYFTLTHKPLSLEADKLSATVRRRIERFAKCRSGNDIRTYTLSAFLIAQIGKNFKIPETLRIPGKDLLALAMDELRLAQYEIGGQVVFLECEDGNRKLKSFYEKNAFVACGKRTDDEDGITYLQMFRFLKHTEEAAA